jgi:hypothetical protein
MKQQRQAEKDKADIALKQQELQQNDVHKKMEIQSRQQIEMAKLQSKQGDDAAKAQQTNTKAMAEREAHQMDLIGKQQDMRLAAQKAAMAQAAHIAKQGDLAARADERKAAQQFKQSQPQGGGFMPT